jgi:hypothetical protein
MLPSASSAAVQVRVVPLASRTALTEAGADGRALVPSVKVPPRAGAALSSMPTPTRAGASATT